MKLVTAISKRWNAGSDTERTLPTTPVALIPRNHGLGSSAAGAVPMDDEGVNLDYRLSAHCLQYDLACKGV